MEKVTEEQWEKAKELHEKADIIKQNKGGIIRNASEKFRAAKPIQDEFIELFGGDPNDYLKLENLTKKFGEEDAEKIIEKQQIFIKMWQSDFAKRLGK